MENITTDFYEINVKGNIAIILFKNNVFNLLSDRNESDLLFEILNKLQSILNIKALLFINESGCYGEKAYDKFLRNIMFPETKSDNIEMENFYDTKARYREINTLNRFVRYIANYGKLCFTVLTGCIVTPFFGLSLATDIRYATPKTFFSLAHNKYGIHPSGGLPYFLVHELGYTKAIELMFSENISSKKALELGLINKIVPEDNYLDIIISDIEKFTKFNNSVLTKTKQLSAFARNSLSDYLEFEGT